LSEYTDLNLERKMFYLKKMKKQKELEKEEMDKAAQSAKSKARV